MRMHNDEIIHKIAVKKFFEQKFRNTSICIAIMLSTFMIYTIFSFGMSFQENMRFLASQLNETTDPVSIIQMIAAILPICICGILIIYNVLYISVVQDIRFLGKLKTLGMTQRQIRKYLCYQIRWFCIIGISAGLILAMLVSNFLVPLALSSINRRLSQIKIQISFSPVLLFGSVFVSLISVFLGSRKPLKIAENISSISMMRYVEISRKRNEKKQEKNSIFSMAWRNVFRRKKSAVIVFLSLFVTEIVSITVNGLFSGVDPYAIVSESTNYDLIVKSDPSQIGNVLTNALREKIADIPGVKRAEMISGISEKDGLTWIETKGHFLEQYSKKLLELIPEDVIEEEKRIHIQDHKYATFLIGIGEWEFHRISEKYNLNTDYEQFRLGELGIWCYGPAYEEPEIRSEKANTDALKVYPSSQSDECFVLENMIEQPVSVTEFKKMGSYLAPNIIVSNEALETFQNHEIREIDILTENLSSDAKVYQILENMFQDYPEVTIYSRQKNIEDLSDSLNTIKIIAAALSYLLFFVSIINFTNLIYTSIFIRERELAMLECMGMTQKQIKKMLIEEGMIYMVITSIMISTLGSIIFHISVNLFAEMTGSTGPYHPFGAALMITFLTFAIAIAVPLICYRSMFANNMIERLKKTEP